MPCGNQDSNLGSLFAEHEVFALKKKQNKHRHQQYPPQTSQLPLDNHEAHFFFFNTPERNFQKCFEQSSCYLPSYIKIGRSQYGFRKNSVFSKLE